MSNNNKNKIDELLEGDFFSNSPTDYEKSKDQVWNELVSKIESTEKNTSNGRKIVPLKTKIYYGIASTLIILLSTGLFIRHYNVSESCPVGEQLIVSLPDESKVTLESGSTIIYYPLWWKISRKVVLIGEAYFDVVKGNKFQVFSPLGNTEVLGTSFNVNANSTKYIVTCFSGSVKVTSVSATSVILNPNYSAQVINGEIKVSKLSEESDNEYNDNNMFDYESMPLSQVMQEIEDHYNITITTDKVLRYNYTGFFSKDKSAEEVLYILCKPYGLTFVVLSNNSYHIVEK